MEFGTKPQDRVQGVFGYNYGARFADITDGTSHTLLTSELVVGAVCTMAAPIATTKARSSWWTTHPAI